MLFTNLLLFGIKLSFLSLKQGSFLDLIASPLAGLFFTSISASFFPSIFPSFLILFSSGRGVGFLYV
jgi:hypothetical protein